MNPATPREYPERMTSPLAAEYLQISERNLFTKTKQGVFPCIRLGRLKFYDRSSLDAALRSLEEGGASGDYEK